MDSPSARPVLCGHLEVALTLAFTTTASSSGASEEGGSDEGHKDDSLSEEARWGALGGSFAMRVACAFRDAEDALRLTFNERSRHQ